MTPRTASVTSILSSEPNTIKSSANEQAVRHYKSAEAWDGFTFDFFLYFSKHLLPSYSLHIFFLITPRSFCPVTMQVQTGKNGVAVL